MTGKKWHFDKKGHHVCNRCITKEKENMAIEKMLPREMTPADRRQIFREIDGNYDEKNSRYIGKATDETIANALKVPRAWVVEVREDNFGPNGGNDEIEQIKSEIGQLRKEIEDKTSQALAAATAIEALTTKLSDMEKRVNEMDQRVKPTKRG